MTNRPDTIYLDHAATTPCDPRVVEAMLPYIDEHLKSDNGTLGHVTRHMLGLFQHMRGAKQWRRYLSENAHRKGASVDTVREALALVSGEDAEALSA